ncbi:Oxysterol-binding protein-domain-containing protein [Lyophyllum atratum]|nr:Oxysterol-binding protein-domain-containing protein [Lyophyllum atratum]
MPTESIRSTSSSNPHAIPTNHNPAAGEPLYQVKLLQALRSGDPTLIHPFLAEIGKDRRKSVEAGQAGNLDTGAAALHLAVRCASVDTVALLLSHRAISPNGIHPPGSGTTPLHLAASLGRVDIVNLLLEQDSINDTLRDAQGRTCRDVARGREVIKAIEDSHSFLNASYRSLLRSYVLSPPTAPPAPSLLSLLSSPRIRHVDLSYLDDGSGHAILHEAARRKDLRLIELVARAGADVFVRDRRGKMAGEGREGRDERVRVFLRQFANHDTTLIDPPENAAEPPVLKGYLNKYTNVAKGYNTRWFVLKNGIFSYYRHQEDETVASRGSISMKTAILKPASSDRLRFEVHAAPSHHSTHHSAGAAAQKWYMKANHPVEAARWTAALGRSIEWCRREGEGAESSNSNSVASGESRTGVRRSGESDESGMRSVRSEAGSKGRYRFSSLRRGGGVSSAPGGGGSGSATSSRVKLGTGEGPGGEDASPDLLPPGRRDEEEDAGDEEGGANAEGEGESSSGEEGGGRVPYEETFELQGNSTIAQMELTSQLLANITSASTPDSNSNSDRAREMGDALKESFSVVQGLLHEYVDMAREREAWWRRRVEGERKRQRFWEESLATVVREGEGLEQELRVRSRRRGSRFFDVGGAGEGTVRVRPSVLGRAVKEELGGEGEGYFPEMNGVLVPTTPKQRGEPVGLVETPVGRVVPKRTQTQDTVTSLPSTFSVTPRPPPISSSGYDDNETDEEDEFFDAIESGTLPNLVVPPALASPSIPHTLTRDMKPYEGYARLREKLDLREERPSTSLWSVLKGSIGKDLTKISFPVFFNEPTSMLQRMAEDMEFTECLDAAARDRDALRRLAFVAAFAMSNYSSTIGRIAKPFNPMLSETFEYVRFDKEYRYVSEQVSHHPPISACWAESPSWHYYGEVDAQNKFMGKSFEIRPTGIAHAELLIPEERGGPGYPKAPGKAGEEGKVVEHYSWKKVTTNVSGFILGSPTIDHYGDMIITNHRTEDQCVMTFKPRGWRGKDAFEIAGEVTDAEGRVAYRIAGRWNSQLIASPASGSSSSTLNPDLEVGSPGTSSSSGAPFVLWRNSDKPVGSPFNLTPFAITLNDCPEDTLRPYLCPTDCRLRPDQRAFEMGKWELANELKNEQEQKQRAIRKAREEGRMGGHRPRWFRAETDGDTGERVWTPARVGEDLEYWVERERVYRAGGVGKVKWKDVDEIFIEAPESIVHK